MHFYLFLSDKKIDIAKFAKVSEEEPVFPLAKKIEESLMPTIPKDKHNIYLATLQHGLELSKNNQERVEAAYLLNPIEKYMVKPIAKVGTNFIHTALKGIWTKILHNFVNPIPTETFLKMGEKIESASRSVVSQQPIAIPVLNDVHKCAIVAARHLFVLSRDMNSVMRLPQMMRSKTEMVFKVAKEEVVDKMAQDYIQSTRKEDPKTLLDIGKNILSSSVILMSADGVSKILENVKNTVTAEITTKELQMKEKILATAMNKASLAALSFGMNWHK